jgi:hypothetical protein
MNSWQLAQQIRHELQLVSWEQGSADLVFGSRGVLVYAGALSEEQHPPGFPFALVTIGSGTPDADDPDLIEQQFGIIAAVQVVGDPMGQGAVIGSSRADYGKSAGAGIAEVGERVRYAIEKLNTYVGASIIVSGSGVGAPASMGKGKHHAFEEYTVTALCTSRPDYQSPEQLQYVDGNIEWQGEWISRRFDFLRYTLGYTSDGVPVASSSDLDAIIYQGTESSFEYAADSGFVYQVFADYNGHGGATPSASSQALRGSYLLT